MPFGSDDPVTVTINGDHSLPHGMARGKLLDRADLTTVRAGPVPKRHASPEARQTIPPGKSTLQFPGPRPASRWKLVMGGRTGVASHGSFGTLFVELDAHNS